MKLAPVEQIAKAVLYEGYMLYPYRPSSVKNRQRFNFGVVYPKSYCDSQEGADTFSMQTECLIQGNWQSRFEARVRFLQLKTRSAQPESSLPDDWQEAVERDVSLQEHTVEELCQTPLSQPFTFPPDDAPHFGKIQGVVDVCAREVGNGLFRIRVCVRNTTSLQEDISDRHIALMQSLVSTHGILGTSGGLFVSLLEPPDDLKHVAAGCENIGLWPVLVGDPGERDTMLASPIILYDYPQIAPESAGDLFDGTEIDEILSLRIMTLTDEEKREIRQSDERARQILDRTETMPAEQFMKLHGAVRSLRPLKENAS